MNSGRESEMVLVIQRNGEGRTVVLEVHEEKNGVYRPLVRMIDSPLALIGSNHTVEILSLPELRK